MEEALEGVKNATNEQDLANRFKEFGKEMVKLNYVAARRQQVLWDITLIGLDSFNFLETVMTK